MPTSISWQKSSFSGGGNGDNRVEAGISAGGMHLRESCAPTVAVATGGARLAAFLRHTQAGS